MTLGAEISDALRRPETADEEIFRRAIWEVGGGGPLNRLAVLPPLDDDARRSISAIPGKDDEVLAGEEIATRRGQHLRQRDPAFGVDANVGEHRIDEPARHQADGALHRFVGTDELRRSPT